MNDNRTGGLLLVAGCAAGLITMALHPVAPPGGGLPSPHALEALARLDRAVHGLAIAGVVAIFLGTLALTRRLTVGAGRLALGALVAYGFAAVAIMIAGAMSGFVGADILSRMAAADPKLESRRMMLDYTFRINQAFAAIFTMGASVAIFLWSVEIVRTRRLPVSLGVYGLVLGPVTVAALFSGHLSLDVHGFGLVALTQAIWFITAGIQLMSNANTMERPELPAVSAAATS